MKLVPLVVALGLAACASGHPYDSLDRQYDAAMQASIVRINAAVARHGRCLDDLAKAHVTLENYDKLPDCEAEFRRDMARAQALDDADTARLDAAGARLDAATQRLMAEPTAASSAPAPLAVPQVPAPGMPSPPPAGPAPSWSATHDYLPPPAPPAQSPAQRLLECGQAHSCAGAFPVQ